MVFVLFWQAYCRVTIYKSQAVAARWAATAWFIGLIDTWQLHAAGCLGQRPTFIYAGTNQIATHLLRHCSGPACCCSQLVGIGLLPTVAPTDLRSPQQKSRPVHAFLEKCDYFRNDDPYRHPSTSPAHIRYVLRAKFRHRTTQRLGGDRSQTK